MEQKEYLSINEAIHALNSETNKSLNEHFFFYDDEDVESESDNSGTLSFTDLGINPENDKIVSFEDFEDKIEERNIKNHKWSCAPGSFEGDERARLFYDNYAKQGTFYLTGSGKNAALFLIADDGKVIDAYDVNDNPVLNKTVIVK